MSAPSTGVLNHPALGAVRYRMDEVSDDPDTQVAQVIGMMRGYALDDAGSPEIQWDASRAVQGTGDPISGVFNFVRGRMGFVNDENTAAPLQPSYQLPIVETLIRPRDMAVASSQIGDCDDYSMYGASLLRALNVPVSFVTVAADAAAPGVYSHVYLAAYPTSGQYAGLRMPMDISHGDYPGWEVVNFRPVSRITEWPVSHGCGVLSWVLAAGAAYTAYALYRDRATKRGAN